MKEQLSSAPTSYRKNHLVPSPLYTFFFFPFFPPYFYGGVHKPITERTRRPQVWTMSIRFLGEDPSVPKTFLFFKELGKDVCNMELSAAVRRHKITHSEPPLYALCCSFILFLLLYSVFHLLLFSSEARCKEIG